MAYDPLALERAYRAQQEHLFRYVQLLAQISQRKSEERLNRIQVLRSLPPSLASKLAPSLGLKFDEVFTEQELEDLKAQEIINRTGGLFILRPNEPPEPVGDAFIRDLIKQDIYRDDGLTIDPEKLDRAISETKTLLKKGYGNAEIVRGDKLPPGITPQTFTAGAVGEAAIRGVTPETKSGAEKGGRTNVSSSTVPVPSTDGDVPSSVPFADKFNKYGSQYGVPPRLLAAIAQTESNFNPLAKSNAGAIGLMQFMPSTAAAYGVIDPTDPDQAIEGAAKYLSELINRYDGDVEKALAAYNAGPTAVDQAGGVPDIQETKDYVKKVLTSDVITQPATQPQPSSSQSSSSSLPSPSTTAASTQQLGTFGQLSPEIQRQGIVGYVASDPKAMAAAGAVFQQETGLQPDFTLLKQEYDSLSNSLVSLSQVLANLDRIIPGDPNSMVALKNQVETMKSSAQAVLDSAAEDPKSVPPATVNEAKHQLETASVLERFISEGTPSTVISASPQIKSFVLGEIDRLENRRRNLWAASYSFFGADRTNLVLGPPPSVSKYATAKPKDITPQVTKKTPGPPGGYVHVPSHQVAALVNDATNTVDGLPNAILDELVDLLPAVHDRETAKAFMISAVFGRTSTPMDTLLDLTNRKISYGTAKKPSKALVDTIFKLNRLRYSYLQAQYGTTEGVK